MKEIPLSRGMVALVDDEDYDYLSQYSWYAKPSGGDTFYAYRSFGVYTKYRKFIMHREIMCPPDGYVVDHIDRNGLNNQRKNLRVCTHAENMHNRRRNTKNSSGYKGVCYAKEVNKWLSQIVVGGKKVKLGYFENVLDAAKAYDTAAVYYFGSFANINFPEENENE